MQRVKQATEMGYTFMAIMKQPVTISTYRRNYVYDGVTYEGHISVKRIRSRMRVHLHYEKKSLSISICPGVSFEELDQFIRSALPGLVKRMEKRLATDRLDEQAIYILGNKQMLEEGETLESVLQGKKKTIVNYFTERVRYYEKLMRISTPYKVRGRLMKTLYGSNSLKTHAITLNLRLFCYSEDCIDSVVVHELAHHVHRNHGRMFYTKVLKYFPNYWYCRKKLIRHIYNDGLINGQSIDNTPMEENDNE